MTAPRWSLPDLAVGVTVEAADVAAALAGAARRAAARTAAKGPDGAARLGGQARQRIDGVARRMTDVAQRGAAERARGRRWAATLVDSVGTAVSTRVATSPMVNRVVDLQINRVLRPLVGNVLDDVLALLEAEPERVRSLVRDQREGIVDDIVAHIRASATIGDVTVDRWTARMLRRTPASAP